jgi:hypothetical protein
MLRESMVDLQNSWELPCPSAGQTEIALTVVLCEWALQCSNDDEWQAPYCSLIWILSAPEILWPEAMVVQWSKTAQQRLSVAIEVRILVRNCFDQHSRVTIEKGSEVSSSVGSALLTTLRLFWKFEAGAFELVRLRMMVGMKREQFDLRFAFEVTEQLKSHVIELGCRNSSWQQHCAWFDFQILRHYQN